MRHRTGQGLRRLGPPARSFPLSCDYARHAGDRGQHVDWPYPKRSSPGTVDALPGCAWPRPGTVGDDKGQAMVAFGLRPGAMIWLSDRFALLVGGLSYEQAVGAAFCPEHLR